MLNKIQISGFILLMIFLAQLSQELAGQGSSRILLPENDTSKTESGVDRHALYTGAGYGSNMIYLGSTISRDQPYSFANITYSLMSRLYVSASAVNLLHFKPLAAFYIGGLSYNHVFNSWFDISGGAYRYQVDKTLADTLFNSFTYGEITLGIDWKLLYTRIGYGRLISQNPQNYLQIKNSRYFQTPGILGNKLNISFDPYIDLLFGTLLTSEIITGTSEVITITQYATPFSSGNDYSGNPTQGSGSGSGSPGGNGYGSPSASGQGSGSGSGSSVPAGTTQTVTTSTSTTTVPVTTTTFKENFGLIEIEFGLPVSFNTDIMTLETEASYILPAYTDPYFPGPKGFVFTLSLFLKIF